MVFIYMSIQQASCGKEALDAEQVRPNQADTCNITITANGILRFYTPEYAFSKSELWLILFSNLDL